MNNSETLFEEFGYKRHIVSFKADLYEKVHKVLQDDSNTEYKVKHWNC